MAAGFAVHALDPRDRGRSDGRRFHVTDVADYADDMARMVGIAKSREPGLPGRSCGRWTKTG